MKSVPAPVVTHLGLEVTTVAKCWKLVRTDGTILRFTSHDVAVTIPGDGKYSSTEGFTGSAIENKADLTVDNLDIQGIFNSDAITLQDLRAGLYDYADVFIFLVNWQSPSDGILKMRRGKLGEVTSSPQGWFMVELRGMTQLLQQQIVELYGPTCRADLFDSRCAISSSSYMCTGHVTSVTDSMDIVIALDTTPSSPFYMAQDGWFQYGVLQWLTGQNAGRGIDVKSWAHTAGDLGLYLPSGYPIQVGDTFNLWPGCDKTRATCKTKFSNLVNMRAEPDLPGNDAAFIYPNLGTG